MKNFLFICGKNKLRSPTAEAIFNEYANISARSAGINSDAEYIVTGEDIEWATHIFLMEKSQRTKLFNKYKNLIKDQKVIVLNIPDKYKYMDPELVQILKMNVIV